MCTGVPKTTEACTRRSRRRSTSRAHRRARCLTRSPVPQRSTATTRARPRHSRVRRTLIFRRRFCPCALRHASRRHRPRRSPSSPSASPAPPVDAQCGNSGAHWQISALGQAAPPRRGRRWLGEPCRGHELRAACCSQTVFGDVLTHVSWCGRQPVLRALQLVLLLPAIKVDLPGSASSDNKQRFVCAARRCHRRPRRRLPWRHGPTHGVETTARCGSSGRATRAALMRAPPVAARAWKPCRRVNTAECAHAVAESFQLACDRQQWTTASKAPYSTTPPGPATTHGLRPTSCSFTDTTNHLRLCLCAGVRRHRHHHRARRCFVAAAPLFCLVALAPAPGASAPCGDDDQWVLGSAGQSCADACSDAGSSKGTCRRPRSGDVCGIARVVAALKRAQTRTRAVGRSPRTSPPAGLATTRRHHPSHVTPQPPHPSPDASARAEASPPPSSPCIAPPPSSPRRHRLAPAAIAFAPAAIAVAPAPVTPIATESIAPCRRRPTCVSTAAARKRAPCSDNGTAAIGAATPRRTRVSSRSAPPPKGTWTDPKPCQRRRHSCDVPGGRGGLLGARQAAVHRSRAHEWCVLRHWLQPRQS